MPAKTRRSALVALILLLVAGAASATMVVAAQPTYPDDFMLSEGSMPTGLQMSESPFFGIAGFGSRDNPTHLPVVALGQAGSRNAPPPVEAWMQALTHEHSGDDDIVILAMRWESRAESRAWADDARSDCNMGTSAVMRHGHIVVVVHAKDSASRGYLTPVVKALDDQVWRIARVC